MSFTDMTATQMLIYTRRCVLMTMTDRVKPGHWNTRTPERT